MGDRPAILAHSSVAELTLRKKLARAPAGLTLPPTMQPRQQAPHPRCRSRRSAPPETVNATVSACAAWAGPQAVRACAPVPLSWRRSLLARPSSPPLVWGQRVSRARVKWDRVLRPRGLRRRCVSRPAAQPCQRLPSFQDGLVSRLSACFSTSLTLTLTCQSPVFFSAKALSGRARLTPPHAHRQACLARSNAHAGQLRAGLRWCCSTRHCWVVGWPISCPLFSHLALTRWCDTVAAQRGRGMR